MNNMSFKLGNNDISKLYIGSDEVSKVFLGSVEIYNSGEEPTPTDRIVGNITNGHLLFPYGDEIPTSGSLEVYVYNDDGYLFPATITSVTGASYTYANGKITLSDRTANQIVITAECPVETGDTKATITETNCTYIGQRYYSSGSGSQTLTGYFIADSGKYMIHDVLSSIYDLATTLYKVKSSSAGKSNDGKVTIRGVASIPHHLYITSTNNIYTNDYYIFENYNSAPKTINLIETIDDQYDVTAVSVQNSNISPTITNTYEQLSLLIPQISNPIQDITINLTVGNAHNFNGEVWTINEQYYYQNGTQYYSYPTITTVPINFTSNSNSYDGFLLYNENDGQKTAGYTNRLMYIEDIEDYEVNNASYGSPNVYTDRNVLCACQGTRGVSYSTTLSDLTWNWTDANYRTLQFDNSNQYSRSLYFFLTEFGTQLLINQSGRNI